ncbi:MAG TPA: hypothetical protein VJQ09_08660, partial [Candidatus Limnocylindria bacterium]|nr:hypothetical protein [Candidatus Limnocylindria bacterium]
KRSLVDAGLGSGAAVELLYSPAPRPALPDPKRIAEAIAADLAKVGIDATPRAMEPASLAAAVRSDVAALWLGERSAERADPDDFVADMTANPVVTELLRRARAESDATKRAELYKQVSKLLQQESARIPLFHSNPPIALSRKISGLVPQPVVGESFALVWLGR